MTLVFVFSCHDNDTTDLAPTVSVWHARPDRFGGSGWALGATDDKRCNSSNGGSGYANYAAGRSSSGIGGFNLFEPNYNGQVYSSSKPISKNCDKQWNSYTSPVGTAAFTQISVPSVTGNGTSGGSVPVFASLIPQSAATVADHVYIQAAGWNAAGTSYLKVIAFNDLNNAVTLRVSYNGQISNANMTWDAVNAYWTYTSTAAVSLTANLVTVSSTATGGGSATASLVDDTLVTSGGSGGGGDPAANHALYNAVPVDTLTDGTACNTCHTNGNLADYHYTKAKSCTWCHGSPVSGVDPYTLNLATVKCLDCHTIDKANHPNKPHTFLLSKAECVSCHTGDIQNTVHNACASCHGAVFDKNNMASGPNGDATLHVVGTSSDCAVCHPNGQPISRIMLHLRMQM